MRRATETRHVWLPLTEPEHTAMVALAQADKLTLPNLLRRAMASYLEDQGLDPEGVLFQERTGSGHFPRRPVAPPAEWLEGLAPRFTRAQAAARWGVSTAQAYHRIRRLIARQRVARDGWTHHPDRKPVHCYRRIDL